MSEQTQDQTTVLQDIVISDSVAVVTGGASGIGKGIVGALLRHGAKVVIADIEQSAIDETVAEMSAHGDVTGIRTDITDEASVKALADAVAQDLQSQRQLECLNLLIHLLH